MRAALGGLQEGAFGVPPEEVRTGGVIVRAEKAQEGRVERGRLGLERGQHGRSGEGRGLTTMVGTRLMR